MEESDNIKTESVDVNESKSDRKKIKINTENPKREGKEQDEGESSQPGRHKRSKSGRTPDTVDAKPWITKVKEAIGMKRQPHIRMPTEHDARYYNMGHKKRGIAYIFSHQEFDEVHKLIPRKGTRKDRDDLERQLQELQFEVRVFDDAKYSRIDKELTKAATMDHSDHDCILICVMTHGDRNILYAHDTMYKPESLWLRFTADKCPSLAGKPKIVILQACRGKELDSGTKMYAGDQLDGGETTIQYTIPNHADFFIGYSTILDHYSWRNPEDGSWYIQSLVEVLQISGKRDDFLTLMTLVTQKVAYDQESYTPDDEKLDQKKQTPSFVSMLTRLLKFEDKMITE